MSFSLLTDTFEDLIKIKKDHDNGLETDQNLLAAKKRAAEALNQYIDNRVDGVIEFRKKRVSINTVSDLLANDVDGKSVLLKTRLLLAPVPLDSLNPGEDQGIVNWLDKLKEYERWMLEYKDWFESVQLNEEQSG